MHCLSLVFRRLLMWDLGTDANWNMTVCLRHKQREGWFCMQSQLSSKSSQKRKYSFFPPPILSIIYRPPGWDSFWNQHHQTHKSQNLIAFISTRSNFVPVSMCSNCSNFSSILGRVRLFSSYDKQLISCDRKMHIMTATVKSASASVMFLELGITISLIFFPIGLNISAIVLHCLLYPFGDICQPFPHLYILRRSSSVCFSLLHHCSDYGFERQTNGKCAPAFWFNASSMSRRCTAGMTFLNTTG